MEKVTLKTYDLTLDITFLC